MAFVVALVVYETWFTKEGMFHHGLFQMGRNYAICLFCVFTDGISFFAANLYFAFEVCLRKTKLLSASMARFAIFPLTLKPGQCAVRD